MRNNIGTVNNIRTSAKRLGDIYKGNVGQIVTFLPFPSCCLLPTIAWSKNMMILNSLFLIPGLHLLATILCISGTEPVSMELSLTLSHLVSLFSTENHICKSTRASYNFCH